MSRSQHRGAEKAITTALGILLIAERAALLSGRDDEFVAVVTLGFTGIRWGELVGLEATFVRPAGIRVEWQLCELDSGQLHRCPPKDESRRGSHRADPAGGVPPPKGCGTCSAGIAPLRVPPGTLGRGWLTWLVVPRSGSARCPPC
jgi:hypothetical protein